MIQQLQTALAEQSAKVEGLRAQGGGGGGAAAAAPPLPASATAPACSEPLLPVTTARSR